MSRLVNYCVLFAASMAKCMQYLKIYLSNFILWESDSHRPCVTVTGAAL